MRIAIAGQTYYPGNNGQAIFTIHLAEGLARAGHEVHVIIPSWDFHLEHLSLNNVQVHKVRSIGFRWLHPEAFFTFLPAGQVKRIFSEHRPDVVHIQDHYFLCRDVSKVAQRMGIPVMGTNHFLPENLLPYLNVLPIPRHLKISILWDLMLWTYNHLAVVTTPTETAARILSGQKIHVPVLPVSCGVDTQRFHPATDLDRETACQTFGLDPHKVLFLYVGRLDHEKRIDLLMRGLARLRAAGRTDMQLALAGQGAARGELQALAQSLGLGEQVRFLGYVPNEQLPLLYQTAQLFAMPSPEELQSIATLEAMASGRPVLAANARALPELVTDGVNGCLFESGQVESAAKQMVALADQRAEWERMGFVSRARAAAHSLENTIRRYEELYRRLSERRDKQVEKSPMRLKTSED